MIDWGARGRSVADSGIVPFAILGGIRCLVVEDHATISRKLEGLLQNAGAATDAASTVDEACHSLADRTFDLVLIDLHLHGASGIAVARHARRLAAPPIVLVITGDPDYLDLDELEALGTQVMLKINLSSNLVAIVRAMIDEHRTRES